MDFIKLKKMLFDVFVTLKRAPFEAGYGFRLRRKLLSHLEIHLMTAAYLAFVQE